MYMTKPKQVQLSERPVDALAVKKVNYSLTHSLKSRDASASKKLQERYEHKQENDLKDL